MVFDYRSHMISIRTALAPLVALVLFFFGATARAEMKIAVVDVDRAVNQTEEGLRANATLKKLFESRQAELDKQQNDLLKQRDDIEKQQKVLSQQALQKRAEEWQKQAMDLQQKFVEYNREVEKKRGELFNPIIEKVLGIVRRIATTEGYDMVVAKQAIPYVRSDLDLTDRCIQMYNSGGGGAAAPAAGDAGAKK
jgi:outer membrane protein